jgi:lipopolysaccharide/colanic/teichoic acid biosynthesis glycosyltransferase
MRFFVKYAFDRIFAFVGIIIAIPFFIILPAIIRIDSKGPVLFKQKRVGKNGDLFTMYKFRSMQLNDGSNTVTSLNDNRITCIGSFLRKWKLDELPELFNVLIGDMSFVGPRPDVPGYADRLEGEDRKILLLRPGVTGPATLKYLDEEEILSLVPDAKQYNDEVIFPDKVRINLKYLEKFSFNGDLKIIFYTLIRRKINEY